MVQVSIKYSDYDSYWLKKLLIKDRNTEEGPKKRDEKFRLESHKRKFTTATSRKTIADMQEDPGEVVCCI